jgi:tetratricopeptide (TPR) repeat protein
MTTSTSMSRRLRLACLGFLVAAGCSAPGSENEDARVSAYAANADGLKAFAAKDYATAEPALVSAVDAGVLNPDIYCQAIVRIAVCRGAAGKYDEALAELDKLGPAAPNQDEIFAARAFILAKQGKAADARTALAKARQINRAVQEFK